MVTGKSNVGLPSANVSNLVERHADAERKIYVLKKGLRRDWLVLGKDAFIYRGKDATALFSKN